MAQHQEYFDNFIASRKKHHYFLLDSFNENATKHNFWRIHWITEGSINRSFWRNLLQCHNKNATFWNICTAKPCGGWMWSKKLPDRKIYYWYKTKNIVGDFFFFRGPIHLTIFMWKIFWECLSHEQTRLDHRMLHCPSIVGILSALAKFLSPEFNVWWSLIGGLSGVLIRENFSGTFLEY